MSCLLIISLATCLPACPPGDPGTVITVDGEARVVLFSTQARGDCRLSYDTSRLALWFDEGLSEPAPPDTTFTAPLHHLGHGDMNGDSLIDGADVQRFVGVLLGLETDPNLINQADFDENAAVDMADVPRFVAALLGEPRTGDMNRDGRVDGNDIQPFVNMLLGDYDLQADLDFDGMVGPADVPPLVDALLLGGLFSQTTITLFAEGLAPSEALCDTHIDLLVDPERDGVFVPADMHEVTVVQITVNPTTVELGTAIVATLQPASGSLCFDSSTTATWFGDYVPILGEPVPLTVAFDAGQVRESSSSQATLIAGDGSYSAPLSVFRSVGSLAGTFTFNLGDIAISVDQNFVVGQPQATLHEITQVYDEDENVSFILGPPAETINVASGPVPSEEVMLVSIFNHYAVVVPVVKNAATLDGPADLTVEVATMDGTTTLVRDNFEIALSRLPDDTDPNYLLYASDINVPLYPINVEVDRSQFTQVIPFETVDNGFVVIVPQEVLP